MAVTNLAIVEYLLDRTVRDQPPLAWREQGAGHVASIHGVHIELFRTEGRGISGLCLCFRHEDDTTWIEEPRISSMFTRRYRDEEERRLAEGMLELRRAIAEQCTRRRVQAAERVESTRQNLYRRILFGEPG